MNDIRLIKLTNKLYPINLKDLADAPAEFYIRGELKPTDEKSVAIVGSRNMSKYGQKVTWEFARELAKAGFTIVSGLARGIDTVAHEAALSVKGRTIAVLGSGLNVIYPPENFNLANRIIDSGALISEFPLDTKPLPCNFLIRNRIISGLSLAVLVVEGAKRSGTFSIASHAANQGKEVFAIPGSIHSPLSETPLYLIENGAMVAKSPQDIIEVLSNKIDAISSPY